ncbi:MAG: DUF3192 domain-containing protein [Candidatus Thiodiazotropha taylori]
MKKLIVTVLVAIFQTGCLPEVAIKDSIEQYEAVESQVELGDSKQRVLDILIPTQNKLHSDWKKRPEKYIKDGVLVEIFYFRSSLQADGLTTDDEFTPYVFNNGKLVAIGWAYLGGSKSQGQTKSQSNVNVQQTTIVY